MAEKLVVQCGTCGKKYRTSADTFKDGSKCPCGGVLAPVEGEGGAQPRSAAEPAAAAAAAQEPAAGKESGAKEIGRDDTALLDKVGDSHRRILEQISKVIVGQTRVVDELLIAVLSGGHCLLEGVPGLAKTLLISSVAKALSLSFKRIQFTPDLMPSDITGTEIIQDDPATGERKFKFLPGPIFANIILADEINRTPPKTQAAMLEAMQERQVSVGGDNYPMEKPFFVLATQNPLEQEGTYPLPEAQQDRFLFKIFVGYPSADEEKQIVNRVTANLFEDIDAVLAAEDVLSAQDIIRRIPVADSVVDYATRLVRSTRVGEGETPDFVSKWVAWGCGPRASISLIAAAKANAALNGRKCASCDDVARVAHPVMRHRMAINYTARAEGMNTDDVVDKLLEAIPKYD